jgi:hypothetical protein
MDHHDLGLIKDHGEIIMSAILICYGVLCTYLQKEYETTDE